MRSIICLRTVKCFQVLLFNTKNSIKHQSFVYTQLKDQTVLFQTTQFSIRQQSYMAPSITMIRICERDIGNLKTRNFTKFVLVRNFIYLLEFKGFSTWGERDTIFLCCLFLHRQLSAQPTPVAHKDVWPRPALKSRLSRSEVGTQLIAFSQISAHASCEWRHPNTLVPIPIWGFYFDISELHILSARAWTPALMLHLTNPCERFSA